MCTRVKIKKIPFLSKIRTPCQISHPFSKVHTPRKNSKPSQKYPPSKNISSQNCVTLVKNPIPSQKYFHQVKKNSVHTSSFLIINNLFCNFSKI